MKAVEPGEKMTGRYTEAKIPFSDEDPVTARILTLVTDLGNTVLAKRAAADLHG